MTRSAPRPARRRGRLLAAALTAGACAPPPDGIDATADGPSRLGSWPAPDGPCALGPVAPTRLLLTTTDYSTGALSLVDPATLTVTPDVAVGSTDAIPVFDAQRDRIVVVHRFGLDYLDVLDADSFIQRGQFAIAGPGSANPQSVAFTRRDGHAWVTTLGSPRLRRMDLSRPPASAEVDTIDLSGFADPDGNPEAGVIVACGSQLYVGLQRLDPSFAPHDFDMLVAIDTDAALGIDLDPERPGGQGLALSGTWLRQLRLDPSDSGGTTLLGLTDGIERIDTKTGTVQWAVDPRRLADAGLTGFRQPQAFVLDANGTQAYLAAYDQGYDEVTLYRLGLDDHAPQRPEAFASGFDSVERTLERIGDTLWYGSTAADAPGLWAFDLTANPPAVVAGPLPTGLPPYSMVALP